MSVQNPESLLDVSIGGLPQTIANGATIPQDEFMTISVRNNWDNILIIKNIRVQTDPRSDFILFDFEPGSGFLDPGEGATYDTYFGRSGFSGSPLPNVGLDPFTGRVSPRDEERQFFAWTTGDFDMVVTVEFGTQQQTFEKTIRESYTVVPNETISSLTAAFSEESESLEISAVIQSNGDAVENARTYSSVYFAGHRTNWSKFEQFTVTPRQPHEIDISVPRSEVAGEVGVCAGLVSNRLAVENNDATPEMFVPTCVPALVPPPTPDAEFELVDFEPPERVTPGSR